MRTTRREWKNMLLAYELIKYWRNMTRHRVTMHGAEAVEPPICPPLPSMPNPCSPRPMLQVFRARLSCPRPSSLSQPQQKIKRTSAQGTQHLRTVTARGQRLYCHVCRMQGRSVCSFCKKCVCSSSTGRSCFAEHVAQHLLQAGWCDARPCLGSP